MSGRINAALAGVVLLGAVSALAVADPTSAPRTFSGTVDRVVDGDTIIVNRERVRLWGIDAPEAAQTCPAPQHLAMFGPIWHCGETATGTLKTMIAVDNRVTCEFKDTDRYKRTVARCWNQGGDLGGRMVALGMAVAYTRYSGSYYADRQSAAQMARIGVWGGEFVQPEEWRKAHR